jgi:uncharacterized damage-inducible protein DinB
MQPPSESTRQRPEPWLRGTKKEVPGVARAVLHALELADEDLRRWCGALTDHEVNASVSGLPSVAFHLRHIARSLDRLLTYAENRALTERQLAGLQDEMAPESTHDLLFAELNESLATSASRILALAAGNLEQPTTVGKKALPTTLGGLLVHIADHTQRHVGQAITTAKLLIAQRR